MTFNWPGARMGIAVAKEIQRNDAALVAPFQFPFSLVLGVSSCRGRQ